MGRGLVVDVAITTGVLGCQRPAAPAFVAPDELGDSEDLGRSGPGRLARSGGNDGVVVHPSDAERDRRSTTPEWSSPPLAMGGSDEMCPLVAATLATGAEVAAMKVRRLGGTGRKVSVVGVGTWQLGGEWGRRFTQPEVDRLLGRARELGVNLVDTAEC
jgi:hypothetical protein